MVLERTDYTLSYKYLLKRQFIFKHFNYFGESFHFNISSWNVYDIDIDSKKCNNNDLQEKRNWL